METSEWLPADETIRKYIIEQERQRFVNSRYHSLLITIAVYIIVLIFVCAFMWMKYDMTMKSKIPYSYRNTYLGWHFSKETLQIGEVASIDTTLGYFDYYSDVLSEMEEREQQREQRIAEAKREAWQELFPGFLLKHLGVLALFILIGIFVVWNAHYRYRRFRDEEFEICYGRCIEKKSDVYRGRYYRSYKYYIIVQSDAGRILGELPITQDMYDMVCRESHLIVARFINEGERLSGAYFAMSE